MDGGHGEIDGGAGDEQGIFPHNLDEIGQILAPLLYEDREILSQSSTEHAEETPHHVGR